MHAGKHQSMPDILALSHGLEAPSSTSECDLASQDTQTGHEVAAGMDHRAEQDPAEVDIPMTIQASATTLHSHNAPDTDAAITKDPSISDEPSIAHGSGSNPASNRSIDWIAPEGVVLHPETQEIIRQVEFYFSDENLPGDAHLLSKTGEFGDGWVSINEILGFKKMRKFKPAARVKASLHQSEKLEIWRNKLIRRKDPLTVPLHVKPKRDPGREKNRMMVEKPWLTKGILKPTGFEADATGGPIKPEEYEEEKRLFDPEEAFTSRIEYAVARFCSKRKMHSSVGNIFTKFLMFGGFATGQRQFVGGLSKKDLEELDKEQILQMTARFEVSEPVLDGCDPDLGDGSWIVDFEGMAKAFFSSYFMAHFGWKSPAILAECTNVLRNFYNYLLLHDVCPEYQDQVMAARELCNTADDELAKLAKVDDAFPGNFNIACSILNQGTYDDIRPANPDADWVLADDKGWMSDADAKAVYFTGLSAHCSEGQLKEAAMRGPHFGIVPGERIGLEVQHIEHIFGPAEVIYNHGGVKNTLIKPTGKLHCVYWDVPNAAPKDLSSSQCYKLKQKLGTKYAFLVEEEILQDCFPGLKFEAVVKRLAIGLEWIDSFDYVYPSFYTWTWNEGIRDWKEPGPPKAWQQRQHKKKANGGGGLAHEEPSLETSPQNETDAV